MNSETLLQIFEPPKGYCGQCVVLTSLNADQEFIEEALLRFLNYNKGTCPTMFLMLDKTALPLNPIKARELEQLEAINESAIAKQHAKVALMQFAKNRDIEEIKYSSDMIFRMVVSTGNWTKNSASKNIEMVFKVDFSTKDEQFDFQLLSDINACKDFLLELKKYYLEHVTWNRANQMFDCIKRLVKETELFKYKCKPRFFSTLGGTPLLHSIAERFEEDLKKRNFIQIGSAFFENSTAPSKPSTINAIDSF